MKTPHTGVYRGKRVRVETKDGLKIMGKFIERDSKNVYVGKSKIPRSEIKSFKIVKGNPHKE